MSELEAAFAWGQESDDGSDQGIAGIVEQSFPRHVRQLWLDVLQRIERLQAVAGGDAALDREVLEVSRSWFAARRQSITVEGRLHFLIHPRLHCASDWLLTRLAELAAEVGCDPRPFITERNEPVRAGARRRLDQLEVTTWPSVLHGGAARRRLSPMV